MKAERNETGPKRSGVHTSLLSSAAPKQPLTCFRLLLTGGGPVRGIDRRGRKASRAVAAPLGADAASASTREVVGMNILRSLSRAAAIVALSAAAFSVAAADYPAPKGGDWVARDFRFHTGEVMPELRLHYTTVGEPSGQPVLILHGTGGSGSGLLTPGFAGELFGPGQALDAAKYFIILPDAIGAGKSLKPSDGLRTKFPLYNYADMVAAQYRLVTEGLGVHHLRLVLGNSMGGMQTWMWGETYPDFMDALVPMASQPTAMASRNWMMRRLLTDAIRKDPAWNNGNYTTQPHFLQMASVFYGIATSGGTLAYQKLAGTHDKADRLVDDRLSAPFAADANDFLYQWDSSRDYDAAPGLERITAPLLAINSADDERNPPETGIMVRELKRVKNGALYLIPASEDTRGHGTTGMAKFWNQQVQALLRTAPRRTM
jgi:homoserine O-acetyltransferase/O-succinyltransferase